ncbi:hypothetical protein Dimus_017521 [Dionaea muscipula]
MWEMFCQIWFLACPGSVLWWLVVWLSLTSGGHRREAGRLVGCKRWVSPFGVKDSGGQVADGDPDPEWSSYLVFFRPVRITAFVSLLSVAAVGRLPASWCSRWAWILGSSRTWWYSQSCRRTSFDAGDSGSAVPTSLGAAVCSGRRRRLVAGNQNGHNKIPAR